MGNNRDGLSITVKLTLNQISCPGYRIKAKDGIVMRIYLFNQFAEIRAKSGVSCLYLDKTYDFYANFNSCFDPAQVSELLGYEDVIIELLQKKGNKDLVMAYFVHPCRSFIYPNPTLTSSLKKYRSQLLKPTRHYEGSIHPELQFSLCSVITECKQPSTGQITSLKQDMQDEDWYIKHRLSAGNRQEKKLFQTQSCKMSPINVRDKTIYNSCRAASRLKEVSCIHGRSCPFCWFPHPEQFCTVCKVYQQYFGRKYSGHANRIVTSAEL